MTLRIPVVEVHHITAAEWAGSIGIGCFIVGSLPKNLLPRFVARKVIGVVVSVGRLMPDQFHKPLFSSAFDLEHHCPLQRAQPIVDQKERHKDRRNTDRHEPFIADVTGGMKDEALGRKLIIKLFDQRLECRPLEPQTELGDAALEKLFVTQRCPIGRFHLAHGITGKETVTPSNEKRRDYLLPKLVQILNKRHCCSVDALNLRIRRFDNKIFVRRMCPTAMTKTEMSGGFVQRSAGENITRP